MGVLQVLDKRTSPTFSLQRHGAAGRLRDARPRPPSVPLAFSATASRLLRAVLAQLDDDISDEQLDELVSSRHAELDRTDDVPFWRLVDEVA